MQAVAEVKGVYKSYGNTQVIRRCSFNIREGEIYGLLGGNGAGKTTLMKMILGLQRTDEGSISFPGREAGGGRAWLAGVGSVIETPVFYEHLDAGRLLSMHLVYMEKEADITGRGRKRFCGPGAVCQPAGRRSFCRDRHDCRRNRMEKAIRDGDNRQRRDSGVFCAKPDCKSA